MLNHWATLLIIFGVIASFVARKLTLTASIIGGMVAGFCWLGAGFTGLAMLGAFFVMASFATSFRFGQKRAEGLAEGVKGRRTVAQVIANGGVAAGCCAMGVLLPGYQPVFQLMAAASLAAAAADSVSSEIGNAIGTRFFNILSFKKDQKGLDGVISPEGTFAGLLASLIIALIYGFGFRWNADIIYILAGGSAGNFFDSLLGAGFERKDQLDNNEVNFLNTAFGAVVSWLLWLIFG